MNLTHSFGYIWHVFYRSFGLTKSESQVRQQINISGACEQDSHLSGSYVGSNNTREVLLGEKVGAPMLYVKQYVRTRAGMILSSGIRLLRLSGLNGGHVEA